MVEQLFCEQKPGVNVVYRYAMVVKKHSCITVGHFSHKIPVLNKEVWPQAIGRQQYFSDLVKS